MTSKLLQIEHETNEKKRTFFGIGVTLVRAFAGGENARKAEKEHSWKESSEEHSGEGLFEGIAEA